ncbi:MAG: aminotransferase class I/II-fold pyridoxal phosphate-dependent enzyme [Rhodocyclales bacterium]|nr:aminotransferase class I/II-fold pyridoxal phosphate-dependent enzyme [Rhodocyclales bacterium]
MKRLNDLAIFGGRPEFHEPLHVGQLYLPEWSGIEAAFRGIFERQWYTNHGPLVRQLDIAFAKFVGVKHAVSVTNGTLGLMILARALEIQGEVIVPAFTFPATAQALAWGGLTPVFCDVDSKTHNLSAELVRRKITSRTRAIMGVHLWGRACAPDDLTSLAKAFSLRLIFDACHAIGCTHQGRRIGGLGDAEVFSFHATKVLNGTEGGCITTNDDILAARLRTIRSFHPSEEFAVVPLRINAKMSEAQAAFALLGLADVPRHVEANRRRYDQYCSRLADLPGLSITSYATGETNNFQYVVADIAPAQAGLTRDQVVEVLHRENVFCRRHFHPGAHRMPPFRNDDRYAGLSLPVTDLLCQRLLLLPNGATVSVEDVDRVCHLVTTILTGAESVRRRLEQQA